MIDDPKFRESLYALTSELSALQPLLTGRSIKGVHAKIIDDLFDAYDRGVRALLLKDAEDYLLVLVNEDDHRHLGVDVQGLEVLNGRELSLLYGSETARVSQGRLVTRMQPFQVKLLSTNKSKYESRQTAGRAYR